MATRPRYRRSLHFTAVLARLHLVRHGEVHNPSGIVYARLAGYGLSDVGRLQARAASDRLGASGASVIATSPLDRSLQTAASIAEGLQLSPAIDDRLSEWALADRWAGIPWADLEAEFPGELEAYATTPTDLPFAPEPLTAVASRMVGVVADLGAAHPGGIAVLVSHQDPVQALRLALTERDLALLQLDKPRHACVISLEARGGSWVETGSWAPEIPSPAFPPLPDTPSR